MHSKILALSLGLAGCGVSTAPAPQVSGPGFGLDLVIGTAGAAGTSTLLYRTTTEDDIPACLRYGSRPIWQASGGVVVLAYTNDPDLLFAADPNTATGRQLVDPIAGDTRPAVSLRLINGERAHSGYTRVDYGQIARAAGARTDLCTIPLETPDGVPARFPCTNDTDCSSINAGTCQTEANFNARGVSPAQFRRRVSCTYVRAQTDTAGTLLSGNP